MDQYQTVKSGCASKGYCLKFFVSSNQFYEIEIRGWPREVFHVNKTRTITIWELNTCDNFVNVTMEDIFVGYCRCNMKCKNTIKNIYKRLYTRNVLLYAGSLKGDAYSHLSRLLWDDVQ